MKAACYHYYGPPEVLKIEEVPRPFSGKKEILVKNHFSTVTVADCRMRGANPWIVRLFAGLFYPRKKILGLEFAGEVVEVGKDVSQFKKGDKVFGSAGMKLGGYGEYIAVKEKTGITIIPKKLTYEEVVALSIGGCTAIYYLRDKAKIKTGQKVMIFGASGSVGTFSVQLAKYYEADVTGVCSGRNITLVSELGADHVIDYTRQDTIELTSKFDIVFDAVGKLSNRTAKQLLQPGGLYLTVNKGMAKGSKDNLEFLLNLVQQNKMKAVIDRTYNLDEIVAAHQYVDSGRKKGNVIIKIN